MWHGIFLRFGGVSKDPFAALNVGAGNGDRKENVAANRARIAELFPRHTLHTARQIHGSRVLRISDRNALKGRETPLTGDAMVCSSRHQLLMIQVADCQAVLLIDPVQKVVANVHSGWRGSIDNIVAKTVAVMAGDYNCLPERILAGVGPSLGPCCAEFKHFRQEIPRNFWPYKDSANHFDFWAVTRDQLAAAGVSLQNIHLSNICTRCNPHLFYSYRAQRQTGRFAAVIGRV